MAISIFIESLASAYYNIKKSHVEQHHSWDVVNLDLREPAYILHSLEHVFSLGEEAGFTKADVIIIVRIISLIAVQITSSTSKCRCYEARHYYVRDIKDTHQRLVMMERGRHRYCNQALRARLCINSFHSHVKIGHAVSQPVKP